jgi:WD40 repeat protein/serine/threonine protein kinase
MTLPDQKTIDETLLQSLVRLDERLREGRVPLDPPDSLSDSQMEQLTIAASCLRELEAAFPRQPSSPSISHPVSIPSRIGRFEIHGVLGSGGFAVVYKGYDEVLDRWVALKIPRPHALAAPDLRKRFVREAQAAAQLDHPHIVPIYEAGEAGDLPYIAYAYCDGPTLAAWLRQRGEPLDNRWAARLLIQLAEAVQYSHERGILHRDIKPSNVLLFSQSSAADDPFPFVPRLSDLGLAKLIESTLEDTATDIVLGTPLYMSPEQAEGRHADIGPQTDIYSLGALLYYLLAGRPPFLAAGLVEALTQVIEREPISLSALNPAVDSQLNTICLKCLEKAPLRRYASAHELAEDLGRFLAGQPIRARPATAVNRSWRWCRRNPVMAMLITAIIMAVIGGIAGVWLHFRQADKLLRELADSNRSLTKAVETANREQTRATRSADELASLLYVADLNLAARSLAENDLASYESFLKPHIPKSAADQDGRDASWQYLWNLGHCAEQVVHQFAGAAYCVRLSADGRFLVAAGADDQIAIFDTATLKPVLSWKAGQTEVNGVAFSPDGRWLASAGDDGTVRIWDWKTGQENARIEAHARQAYDAIFTNDSRELITCGLDNDIRIWSVPDGTKIAELTGHTASVECMDLSPDGTRLVSGGDDKTRRVWDVKQRRQLEEKQPGQSRILAVSFTSDGMHFCSGNVEGLALLERPEPSADSEAVRTLLEFGNGVQDVIASPLSGLVAIASRDGMVQLVADSAQTVEDDSFIPFDAKRWVAHVGRVYSQVFSPDANYLFSAGQDGKVTRWQLRTLPVVSTFTIPHDAETAPMHFAVFPRSRRVAFVIATKLGRWDPDSGETEVWGDVRPRSTCMTASSAKQSVILGYEDGVLEAWNHEPDRLTPSWKQVVSSHLPVEAVCMSAQQDRVAAATTTNEPVRIFDAETGSIVTEFKFPEGVNSGEIMWSLSFSRDGQWLAAGTSKYVVAWDVNGFSRFLKGHSSSVSQVDFHPYQPLLLSASHDRTLRLWDLNSGAEIAVLRGHRGEIRAAMFSGDGKTILSSANDGTVKLWHVETRKELFDVVRSPHSAEALKLVPHGGSGLLVGARSENRVFSIQAPMANFGSY